MGLEDHGVSERESGGDRPDCQVGGEVEWGDDRNDTDRNPVGGGLALATRQGAIKIQLGQFCGFPKLGGHEVNLELGLGHRRTGLVNQPRNQLVPVCTHIICCSRENGDPFLPDCRPLPLSRK